MSQHVTLARCKLEVRHMCIWILMPEINIIEDRPWIQQQWHRCAFGSSDPYLSVSDDLCKFIIISLIIFRWLLEGDLFLLRTWPRTSSSSSLFLQQRGSS